MNAGRLVDHDLTEQAQTLVERSRELADWVAEFARQRKGTVHAISLDDQFRLMRLRQQAQRLDVAAGVPVAVALFGPSQAGKSLFIGQVLKSPGEGTQTIGWQHDTNAEVVSFQEDLNPGRGGSHEATALVTRFTTSQRAPNGTTRDFPIAVRPLTRAEWICVMAKGFESECSRPNERLTGRKLEGIVEEIHKKFPATEVDGNWRADIVDAFSFLSKSVRPDNVSHPYDTVDRSDGNDTQFSTALTQHPLSEKGYDQLVERLFWPGNPALTADYRRVIDFLEAIAPIERDVQSNSREQVIVTECRAVRFLLDCKRNPHASYKNLGDVSWDEFRLLRDDRGRLRLARSKEGEPVSLELMQAAMKEMVVPVVTQHLDRDWEAVLDQMDILDFPGLRPGRAGGVTKEALDDSKERADLVIRGKVDYLFELYARTLQIQTVMTFIPNRSLDVAQQLADRLNAWGDIRFGAAWTRGIPAELSPLLVGLTVFDRSLHSNMDQTMFDSWMEEFTQVMGDSVLHFRQVDSPFDDFHLVRYPGTLDWYPEERPGDLPSDLFERARDLYHASDSVKVHIGEATERFDCAMDHTDGGLSLIAPKFVDGTSHEDRRADLQRRLAESIAEFSQLPIHWLVDTDKVLARQARVDLGEKLLQWLDAGPRYTKWRLRAIQICLGLPPSLANYVADIYHDTEENEMTIAKRIEEVIPVFWSMWEGAATRKWRDWMNAKQEELEEKFETYFDPQSFSAEDFAKLAAWLGEFLRSDTQRARVGEILLGILRSRGRDSVALKEARRRLVNVVLNDVIQNPGVEPLPAAETSPDDEHPHITEVLSRWATRLPDALGAGCSDGAVSPPGNSELKEMLDRWNLEIRKTTSQ